MDVREQWQKIKENLYEGLNFEPEYVREFYTNNIIQRIMGLIFGKSNTGIKPVAVSENGAVKVAIEGGAKTQYQSYEGAATDTETVLIFDSVTSTIDLIIYDNDVKIALSNDGVVWGDWFTVKAGEMRSIDYNAKAVKIVNAIAGSVGKYQIIGWW